MYTCLLAAKVSVKKDKQHKPSKPKKRERRRQKFSFGLFEWNLLIQHFNFCWNYDRCSQIKKKKQIKRGKNVNECEMKCTRLFWQISSQFWWFDTFCMFFDSCWFLFCSLPSPLIPFHMLKWTHLVNEYETCLAN